MNTISYESGNAIIPFNEVPIRIGNRIYKNITAVVRLLSAPEIIRLDKMRMSNSYDEEVINDDIVKLCLIDIIGVEGEINLDETSAGFVTTLAKSIYLYSIDHVVNAASHVGEYMNGITILDNICAIVSKYLNISYLEVRNMPVNQVYQMFAVCRSTFPNDVNDIQEKEEVSTVSQIGVND